MSTSAIAVAMATPRGSRASRLNARNPISSRPTTTASVYFVSRPMPMATPSSGQLPRPSAICSARRSTHMVASWSNDTGWNRPLVATSSGEKPTSTPANT